jgi:hypothetical protein
MCLAREICETGKEGLNNNVCLKIIDSSFA